MKRSSERVTVFKLQSKSQRFSEFSGESGKQLKKIRDNSKHCYLSSEPQSGIFGPSVIIGSQKTQIYQWFAGSRQEGFILKIQNSENNAAYVDSRRRFI